MALTPSTMTELGTPAADFNLKDPTDTEWTLDSFAGYKALMVMFICNHCPYVKHLKAALSEFARDYEGKGLGIIAINSNDIQSYPEDAPEEMAKDIATFGYSFPYVFDEEQLAARAYNASCTPDFFLFNQQRKLAYRGQFDDSRPGNGLPVTGKDLRNATDQLLTGKQPDAEQKPSIGCNIKWRN